MGIFERAVTRESVDEALEKLPERQDPRTNPVISRALREAYEPVVKENKEWDDKKFQEQIDNMNGDKNAIQYISEMLHGLDSSLDKFDDDCVIQFVEEISGGKRIKILAATATVSLKKYEKQIENL